MTTEELINVFKYIVKKCDMLVNNDNYEADDYTQDTVEDIGELCNHILDGDYGQLVEVKEPANEDLPHIRHRDTLDEFAYQCAYDLSNDWVKETPEWKDVETACKLGAQWQKQQMMKNAVEVETYDDWRYGKDDDETTPFAIKYRSPDFKLKQKVKIIIITE